MKEKEFAIKYTNANANQVADLLKIIKTGCFDIKMLCEEIVKITHPKFNKKVLTDNKHPFIEYQENYLDVSLHDCSYMLIPYKNVLKGGYYTRNDAYIFKKSYFQSISPIYCMKSFYEKTRKNFNKNLYGVLKKYDKNVKFFKKDLDCPNY